MRRARIAAALVLGMVATAGMAAAQPFERLVAPFPVLDSVGTSIEHPFLGGFDAPRPQLADLDGDGDAELLVQEATGRVMLFEQAEGTFRWRTDAYAGLDVGEWFVLADADADGDLDVLAEQPLGFVRYYRNDGSSAGARFTLVEDTVRLAGGAPLFVDRQNRPAFADFDCDGDLDLLTATLAGTLVYYEGLGADARGVPRLRFVSDRYQGIEIIGGAGKRAPPSVLHGANALALADVDADGDLDLVWGDFFSPSLYLIENVGTCAAPVLQRATDRFPLAEPVLTAGFNVPSFGDLEGDGAADLVVGVLGGAFAGRRSVDNLWLYRRRAGGRYDLVTRRLVGGLDLGEETAPALGDLDGDGRLDLVAGTRIDPDAPTQALFAAFDNTGTATAPRLQAAAGRVPAPAGLALAPALGDLDGDGRLDLVVGSFDGALRLYLRTAAGGWTAPAELASLRGNLVRPTLGDLDGDGLLDLVVGAASGEVVWLRNAGTPQAPAFAAGSPLPGVAVGSRSAPALFDADGDGDLDLFVGSAQEGVLYFRNDGSPAEPRFVPTGTPLLPDVKATAPAVGDLDGDGDPDLVVGNARGGFFYLQNARFATRRAAPGVLPAVAMTAAPNPSPGGFTVRFSLGRAQPVRLVAYDALGRRVATLAGGVFAAGPHAVPAVLGASGAYVLRLETAEGRVLARVLLFRTG